MFSGVEVWLTRFPLGEKERRKKAEIERRLVESSGRTGNSDFSRELTEEFLRDPQPSGNSWSAGPSFPIASSMERNYASYPQSQPVVPIWAWLAATNPDQNSSRFLEQNMIILADAIQIHLRHLAISMEQLLNKAARSPFVGYHDPYGNFVGPGYEVEQVIARIRVSMPSLAPLEIQRSVPHHPYIDLMPFPEFRQAILEQLRDNPYSINQVELCQDLEDGGLRLRGQYPYQPTGYELTEAFAAKWGYLFLGEQVIAATNFWRGLRNERPLRVENFGCTHSGGRSQARFRDLKLVEVLGNDS